MGVDEDHGVLLSTARQTYQRGSQEGAVYEGFIKGNYQRYGQEAALLQRRSKSIDALYSDSSFESWFTTLVQFGAPKTPMSSCLVEHLQNSQNSLQLFAPSINLFSRHTRVLRGKLSNLAILPFPPNPVLLLSPTFTLGLQDPN